MRGLDGVLVVVGALVVTGAATAFAFRPDYAGTATFPAAIVGASAVLAAVALGWAHRDGELRDWLRPRWGDFSVGAITAAALFGVTYAIGKVLAPEASPRSAWMLRLYLQLGSPDVLRAKAFLVAFGVIVFAITDALVWRGLVPSALASRVGSRTAWIWSGLLYGLAYVPAAMMLREGGAGPNLLLVACALATGWILGAATRVVGRLFPTMIAHALFAWFALMTYRFFAPSV